MNKEKAIINLMKQKDYKPMNIKQLAYILMLPKEEIKNILKILADKKIIIKENSKYKLLEKSNDMKNTIVGIYKSSKNFGFVIPDNKEIKTDIYIENKYKNKAKDNYKVVVKIIKQATKNKNPEGKVVEVIGHVNSFKTDYLSIVKQFELPNEFPQTVVEEVKNINTLIDKKDIPNRVDLRDKKFFTVDGEDAKDLDDAVCIEKNEDGTYKLYVSIADVSYYVKPATALDKEALYRGTSVYFLNTVIPMLPKELSNGICSLNQGQDRFCITVCMNIDSNGIVLSSDIYKSIINVEKRMNYTNVSAILKNKKVKEYEEYKTELRLMEDLTNILKEKRKKDGSLELDIPESKIILDENGNSIDIMPYEIDIANEIIEQFMILANEQVAERFFWMEAPFIYRVHEVPDLDKVKELNGFLYNLGYKIKITNDTVFPSAFAKVLEQVKGSQEEKVVANLILRTLKLARYENTNDGHFGLASKYYCHFTSPIRRYPDLFIHRIISEYLTNSMTEKKIEKYNKQAKKYSELSSEREKIATKAEREADDLKKAEYMQDKIGNIYTGIISSITSFGMFVELENTVEGLVRFENIGNDFYIFDEEHKLLKGQNSKKVYKIGDKVDVEVLDASKITRKVSFKLLEKKGS